MIPWLALTPTAPGWRIDWPAVEDCFPEVDALAACPQEPEYHGEGDVWTHTRLACEALAADPAYRALPADERDLLFTTVLLHDVAKPACTRTEPDGRLSSRGHARRGSIHARELLWRLGAPFAFRERVAALIRHHQAPFHLLEDGDPIRKTITVCQTARADHLALLASADARGRICADGDRLLESVALFAEQARELGCLTGPYPFASDHARFCYFRTPDRDPAYAAHDDTRTEVLLLSGLPGAGKDAWLKAERPDWPVISLDTLRAQLRVRPEDDQAPVANRAREQAREYLRRGERFAWNATNLSRDLRARSIDLFAAYGARVTTVYVEAGPERLFAQNRQRPINEAVPERVIERLLRRWEIPDLTETHGLILAVR